MELLPVGIVGVGSYVTDKALTNHDLEKMVDTTDEWIRTRTGIKERRLVEDGKCTSDLALEASKKAIADAGLRSSDIDMIVCGTSSPDMIFPSTACMTAHKLGVKNIPAFDILAACSGFVYAISSAAQYVASGAYQNVLVLGADSLTRYVDWKDRNTCILFGDGAGAVVLNRVDEGYGVLASYLSADGEGADILKIPAGGSAIPATAESVKEGLHFVTMNGNEVFKFAVKAIPEAIEKVLSECNIEVREVKYYILHQANKRITEAAASRLKVALSKFAGNIEKYGNTSAASIPLVLDELYRDEKLAKGDVLVLVGFGGGLTWGANVIRWNKE